MKKHLLKYLLLILIHIINLPQILVMYMFSLISFIGDIADDIANFINCNCLIGKKLVIKYRKISREILREKGKWC